MASEVFDDDVWDANFEAQVVQAEELARAQFSRSQHSHPHPLPPPHPQPLPPPHPQPLRAPPCDFSYSPPRQLSQRTHEPPFACGIQEYSESYLPRGTHFAKEQESKRLKKELERVSKELSHLEEECLELRKERDAKEQQMRVLNSRIEVKDAELHLAKKSEIPAGPGLSMAPENSNASNMQLGSGTKSYNGTVEQTYKSIGVQTSIVRNASWRSDKLLGTWNSDSQNNGRDLVGKLSVTCERDFHVLFGYLNSPRNDSNATVSDETFPTQPIETTKVSRLYSVLAKISNGDLGLEELLEALADLCSLKNVVIIYRSLHVLHQILSSSFNMENRSNRRENIIVDGNSLRETEVDLNACGYSENEGLCTANVAEMLKQGQIPFGMKASNVKSPGSSGRIRFLDHWSGASVSGACWFSLFRLMCRIVTENNEQRIHHEAVSIMNLILMRHSAYFERDKFLEELVFQSLSRLLRKEAGFSVQDQAVQTLYLLCNCPKVMAMLFSVVVKDGEVSCSGNDTDKPNAAFQGWNEILIGLGDSVARCGSATEEELKLRRNAIVFLAFLGSSGKQGIEILLYHHLPNGPNFLGIILQGLLSDLDLLEPKSDPKSGVLRELTLLVREALIFLNRLVSHPQYAIPVLHVLTNTRHMASMTVEFTMRLTQKNKLLWLEDRTTKPVKESEIIDLANVLKRRVSIFVGDSVS